MVLFLASVCTALFVSACCSLMEAVLLSLTPSQIGEITARRPRIGAVWQQFKSNIDRPIAAILILNTAAHTIGAAVAGSQFDELFGDQWIFAFSLVFTYLMLQFTEILPKTIGVRYNRDVALWIAGPLSVLTRVMRPVVSLVHVLNKPFEGRRRPTPPHAVEEIAALAGLAQDFESDQSASGTDHSQRDAVVAAQSARSHDSTRARLVSFHLHVHRRGADRGAPGGAHPFSGQ